MAPRAEGEVMEEFWPKARVWVDRFNQALKSPEVYRYIPGIAVSKNDGSLIGYDYGSTGSRNPPIGYYAAFLRPKDLPEKFKYLLPGTF